MKSKILKDTVDAIKSNKADAKVIQSKLTYSELIPLLFKENYQQNKPEKSYSKEWNQAISNYGDYGDYGDYVDIDAVKNMLKKSPHIIVKGVDASPGLALGKIAFNYNTMEKLLQRNKKLIFMRPFAKPRDIPYIRQASAIITSEGGAQSHAAVYGRQFTIPTITGCSQIKIDVEMQKIKIFIESSSYEYFEGETDVLVDGTNGKAYFFSTRRTHDDETLVSVSMQNDDTVEVISNYIYTRIQNHEIVSFGLELAYLVMILKMNTIHSLPKISEFFVDFEYLASFKQDNVLWVALLPSLKKLCSKIKEFITSNSDNHTETKKAILLILSRINNMASQSIDHHHQMILLLEVARKIDNLVSSYDFGDRWAPNISSPNILVVEDEPYLIADTIQRLKSELNANVNIVTNASDAIEIIRSNAVLNLAIVDLMIPSGRDQSLDTDPYKGIDVSTMIKKIKGENFPVIFLTSVRDTNVLAKIFDSTVSRVINKPSLASSIVETAKEMLQNTNFSDAKLLEGEIQRRNLELESSDPSMRIRALWALFQYANHDSEIISKINSISETDSNEQVRLVAKKILAQPLTLKNEQFDHQNRLGDKSVDNRSVIIQGNVENSIIILGEENYVQTNK